jgi:hypothetical protein
LQLVKTLLHHLEERLWKAAPDARLAAWLDLVGGLAFACRRGALPGPELGRRLRDACAILGRRADQEPLARLLATLRSLADELQRTPEAAEEVLRELDLLLERVQSDPALSPRPGTR